ncbi:zinc finger X-chromosomal protein-like [Ptiloglossa arizonensis]|uniref:zinc finger X-chromosomal protein-like n=1 Tax=Ptiloglossa arizonensis TaxID=3350558 RepID=UPI003FA0B75F
MVSFSGCFLCTCFIRTITLRRPEYLFLYFFSIPAKHSNVSRVITGSGPTRDNSRGRTKETRSLCDNSRDDFGLLHWVRTPSKPRRMYPCGKCQKIYSNASSLYRHLKLECGILPQFHCPYCRFSSKRKFNLDSHVAHKHRKSLQCYINE